MVDFLKEKIKTGPAVTADTPLAKPKKPVARKPSQAVPNLPVEQPVETVGQLDTKVDIKRYQDPEGLSVEKLELGLWAIKHRRDFLHAGYAVLIAISAITWSIFLYHFGSYYITGWRADNRMAAALSNNPGINHDVLIAQQASPISFSQPLILPVDAGKSDLAVELSNENDTHYAYYRYHFELDGKMGPTGSGFLLPLERKYHLELGQDVNARSGTVRFVLEDVRFERITARTIDNWPEFRSDRLRFDTSDIVLTPARSSSLSERLNLNTISFTAVNRGTFSYWEPAFNILLLDELRPVAVNRILAKEFIANETRTLAATWPGTLPRYTEIRIVPEVDILDLDVFMDQTRALNP